MKRIMFVCLGNICRSTMAEAVMRKSLEDEKIVDKFYVSSGGTSAEIGYGVHRGTVKKLLEKGIDPKVYIKGSKGYQVKSEDYDNYDVFYCMDKTNVEDLKNIFNGDKLEKVKLLLDRDIRDPWYTGNFDETYEDVKKGVEKIIKEK